MTIPHPLLEQVIQTCRQYALIESGDTLIIGVSGGVDSLVLLHVLRSLATERNLTLHVATLDHGLRGADGTSDALTVEKIAREWGLSCSVGTLNVAAIAHDYHLNIEEAARQARYTFLWQIAIENDAETIIVAHNNDDQAETMLMHLIRGSGLDGLQGIQYISPLSEYHLLEDWDEIISAQRQNHDNTALSPIDISDLEPSDFNIVRPLLDVPRTLIEDYAAVHQLTPCQDQSNADTKRLRNAIRHEVIPLLKTYNPNIKASLTRLATTIQADVDILDTKVDSVASWLLNWMDTEPDSTDPNAEAGEAVFLDRSAFADQTVGIQRRILRKIVNEIAGGLRELSFDHVEQARQMILSGKTGAQYDLPADLMLVIGYDEATIGYGGEPVYPPHLPSLEALQKVLIDPEGTGFTTGNMQLMTYWVVQGRSTDYHPPSPLECTLSIPNDAKIALRTWESGDRFRPFGMDGKSQKLSDTFINIKVPAYYRSRVPLLTINDEIAWFVAPTASGPRSRIADTFAIRDDSKSILRFRWQIHEPDLK